MSMTIQERIAAREAEALARDGAAQSDIEQTGGGEFKVAPEGKARARLVGYAEIGEHATKAELASGTPAKSKFMLAFALYGKNKAGESWELENGKPMLIYTRPWLISRNEKATAVKMFSQMCPKRNASNFIGLLGRSFWVNVTHFVSEQVNQKTKEKMVFANIEEASLKPAMIEVLDEETYDVIGEKEVSVPMPDDDMYFIFEWDVPNKEDIERLPNFVLNRIRAAENFKGSAIEALVPAKEGDKGDGKEQITQDPTAGDEEEVKQQEPVTSIEVDQDDLPAL